MKTCLIFFVLIFQSAELFSQAKSLRTVDSLTFLQKSEFAISDSGSGYKLRIIRSEGRSKVLGILENCSKHNIGYADILDTGYYKCGYWSMGYDPGEGIWEDASNFFVKIIKPHSVDSFDIDISTYEKYQVSFRICLNVDHVKRYLKKKQGEVIFDSGGRLRVVGYDTGYSVDVPGLFVDIYIEDVSKDFEKYKYVRVRRENYK